MREKAQASEEAEEAESGGDGCECEEYGFCGGVFYCRAYGDRVDEGEGEHYVSEQVRVVPLVESEFWAEEGAGEEDYEHYDEGKLAQEDEIVEG